MNQNPKVTDDKIKDFIDLFDTHTTGAIEAIQAYHLRTEKLLEAGEARAARKTSGEVLLSARDITKTYKIGRQKVDAIKGISLDIHKGEFIALTGASGSGKSTLLQIIGGLDKPTSGSIHVDNIDISKLHDKKLSNFRGQTIGFVFQFFYLQPFLRLRKNLEVPGMFAGVKRSERKK